MRDVLLSDARALEKRGLFDGSRLKELKGTVGHRAVAFDLLALAQMFREQATKILGK